MSTRRSSSARCSSESPYGAGSPGGPLGGTFCFGPQSSTGASVVGGPSGSDPSGGVAVGGSVEGIGSDIAGSLGAEGWSFGGGSSDAGAGSGSGGVVSAGTGTGTWGRSGGFGRGRSASPGRPVWGRVVT